MRRGLTKLFISDVSPLSCNHLYTKYENMIDDVRRKKLLQCVNEEDRRRSLIAGYLIQAGVKEWLYGESGLQADAAPLSLAYTYGDNGKPYLKDYKDMHFSLSHSGRYVICAFSGHEIGADIQEHRSVKDGLAERFYSEEDKRLLESMGAKAGFYKIWSIKEAFMKLTGEGMGQGLESTVVEPDTEGMEMYKQYGAGQLWNSGRIRKKAQIIQKQPISGMGGMSKEEGCRNRGTRKKDRAYFTLCDILEEYSIAVCSYEKVSDINIEIVKIREERV